MWGVSGRCKARPLTQMLGMEVIGFLQTPRPHSQPFPSPVSRGLHLCQGLSVQQTHLASWGPVEIPREAEGALTWPCWEQRPNPGHSPRAHDPSGLGSEDTTETFAPAQDAEKRLCGSTLGDW